MFCTNCGKEIPDGSKFCILCGASLIQNEPPVQQEIIEEPAHQEPVYERTYTQPQEPQQPSYQQAYTAPAYQQQGYPAQAQPVDPRKFRTTRWPGACGTMGILYFFFFMLSLVAWVLYYVDEYVPIGSYLGTRVIGFLIAVAVPVLFLVHTKKIAFITAIPMIAMVIMDGISYGNIMRHMSMSGQMAFEFVTFIVTIILAILYLLQMIIRPHNPTMPIIFLIFAILLLVARLILLFAGLFDGYMPTFVICASILTFVSEIFLYIGYMVAMFSSRKR